MSVQPQEKEIHDVGISSNRLSMVCYQRVARFHSSHVITQCPTLLSGPYGGVKDNQDAKKTMISPSREMPRALGFEEWLAPLCSSLMQNHEFMEETTLEMFLLLVHLLCLSRDTVTTAVVLPNGSEARCSYHSPSGSWSFLIICIY